MDKDVLVLEAKTSFDAFLRLPENRNRMRHVVVRDGRRIVGVLRVNTSLRHGLEGADTGVTLGDVASPNFTVVGEDKIVFDVIGRIWRRNAVMAVVVSGHGVPRPDNVRGVITKEHVADSVAASIKVYPT
jgi:CIC family chloride channel protein